MKKVHKEKIQRMSKHVIGSVKLCKHVHFLFKVFYTNIKCAKGANDFSYMGKHCQHKGDIKGGHSQVRGNNFPIPSIGNLVQSESRKDSSITVISIHDGHFDRLFTLRFFFYCDKNILIRQIRKV